MHRSVEHEPGGANPAGKRRSSRTESSKQSPESENAERCDERSHSEVADRRCPKRQPCGNRTDQGLERRLRPCRSLSRENVVAEDGISGRKRICVLLHICRPVHDVDIVAVGPHHHEAEQGSQQRQKEYRPDSQGRVPRLGISLNARIASLHDPEPVAEHGNREHPDDRPGTTVRFEKRQQQGDDESPAERDRVECGGRPPGHLYPGRPGPAKNQPEEHHADEDPRRHREVAVQAEQHGHLEDDGPDRKGDDDCVDREVHSSRESISGLGRWTGALRSVVDQARAGHVPTS